VKTALDTLWYWVQLAIWPLIRDTDCMYCIFLRGVVAGIVVSQLGVWLWKTL